jgi:hypothetical protein
MSPEKSNATQSGIELRASFKDTSLPGIQKVPSFMWGRLFEVSVVLAVNKSRAY